MKTIDVFYPVSIIQKCICSTRSPLKRKTMANKMQFVFDEKKNTRIRFIFIFSWVCYIITQSGEKSVFKSESCI